ncbi:MAG: hypothetical protein H7258_12285 [Ferruginibacter sp.]|nr:hypothetical protein [Ferruginibacter sp.]
MKKLIISVITIFMVVFLSSCYQMVFKSLGVLSDSAHVLEARNTQKQIVYIPMHHIGKRTFYNDVKTKIDSLRKLGFVFYYEGVVFSKENDSLKNDTIAMKLRKITGVDFRAMHLQGGYIDTLTNKVMGVKIKSIDKYDLVNQPKGPFYFDTLSDRKVDVYLSDALPALEEKFGRIILNECDFKTGSNEKYTCKKYKKKGGKKFLTLDYRNDFIANQIINDNHTKIAMIYGAKHFEGILKQLKIRDSTWKAY